MVLQTLFALYSLLPAGAVASTGAVEKPAPYRPLTVRSTITIKGGRLFAADVMSPNPGFFESRYPGAVIIATEKTRERAFLLGSRMAEIGVTVIMYTQEEYGTHRLRVFDARSAVDSMRRRGDVRPEEVGVIAFDDATIVVPDLVRDTTLNFAIAATSKESVRDLASRYSRVRAATLLVQGIENLEYGGIPLLGSVTPGVIFQPIFVAPPALKVKTLPKAEAAKILQQQVAPNVTVWPVPREQLEGIGEIHSPLGSRVVSWVREQVHARPGMQLSAALP